MCRLVVDWSIALRGISGTLSLFFLCSVPHAWLAPPRVCCHPVARWSSLAALCIASEAAEQDGVPRIAMDYLFLSIVDQGERSPAIGHQGHDANVHIRACGAKERRLPLY